MATTTDKPQPDPAKVAEMHATRAYPMPAPEDDPRFTFGLMLEVARVLEEHGYPKITNGLDLVELQGALWRFLYKLPDQGEDVTKK